MSLKVIAGIYGSRVLRTVRGLGTRPLLGQVKAAVFNILVEQVPGALVWDLFAGTGASGIEALSRGARQAVFIEKNNKAIDVLRGNLRMLGAEGESLILRGDAWEPPVVHRGLLSGEVAVGAPPAPEAPRARDEDVRGEDARDERDDSDESSDSAGDEPVGDDATPVVQVPASVEVPPDIIFLDPPYALVVEDPVKCMARARKLVQRLAPGGCVVFHFEAGALDEDDFDGDLTVDLREWGSSAIAFLWRAGEAPARVLRRRERALSGE